MARSHRSLVRGRDGFHLLEATVLFADLRGSTALVAGYPAVVVLDLLDRFLVKMSEVVASHHGTIDKFLGDSVMVLFGAPTSRADDVRNAVLCAVEMQNAMLELNEDNVRRGLPRLYLGIGINTGTVMAGTLGSDRYSTYTVVGEDVGIASRIESFSLRGQVLLSERTFERVGSLVEASAPMDIFVKGKPEPLRVRDLRSVPSLGLAVPRQEPRRSPRVAVKMPIAYQLVQNKVVVPITRVGTLVDLGYDGVLADLDDEVAGHADLKLEVDLSVIGRRAADIYARAVRTLHRDGRRLTGIEFTSVSDESEMHIRQFVQMLLPGSAEA